MAEEREEPSELKEGNEGSGDPEEGKGVGFKSTPPIKLPKRGPPEKDEEIGQVRLNTEMGTILPRLFIQRVGILAIGTPMPKRACIQEALAKSFGEIYESLLNFWAASSVNKQDFMDFVADLRLYTGAMCLIASKHYRKKEYREKVVDCMFQLGEKLVACIKGEPARPTEYDSIETGEERRVVYDPFQSKLSLAKEEAKEASNGD